MSKLIVQAVQSQPALQKRDVLLAVVKVGTAITAIDQLLLTLDRDRKRFHEIGHQLMSGAQERNKLRRLMDRLIRAKDNLTAIITITHSQPAAPVSRRIVRQNRSSDNARQFNAPVVKGVPGQDPWKDICEVIVEDNEATGQSIQLNIAMTSGDLETAFKILAGSEQRQVDDELDREADAGLYQEPL